MCACAFIFCRHSLSAAHFIQWLRATDEQKTKQCVNDDDDVDDVDVADE